MPLRPAFIVAGRLWRWYANSAGFVLLSLAIAYVVVQGASGDGAVILADDVRPIITRTTPEGSIAFIYNLQRYEPCPGQVVQLWTRGEGRDGVMVQTSRPAVNMEVKYYDDLRINVGLPAAVTPGKWRYRSSMDSTCPNRQRTDPIADFEFEVVPR